jgi:ABC-type transport system substrate-binding protein
MLAACSLADRQHQPVPTLTVAQLQPTIPPPPDILRWSLDGITQLPSLDPARPEGVQSNTLLSLVFGGLIRLDEKLEIQPDCAAEWTVSADGRVYTFTLRDGLVFADGTPATAADFVYSITRALQPETVSFGAPSQLNHIVGATDVIEGRATQLAGVQALDPRTLQITLDGPLAFFLAQLAYPYTYVVPRNPKDTAAVHCR